MFGSPVQDKDPFSREACSDSGAFASPRFDRLAGKNKPTRVMIAVRSSVRGILRFMGAIFFLSPCPLREEPAVHALAGARLDSCQSLGGGRTSPHQTQQAGPAWARPYHNFFQVGIAAARGGPAACVKTSRVVVLHPWCAGFSADAGEVERWPSAPVDSRRSLLHPPTDTLFANTIAIDGEFHCRFAMLYEADHPIHTLRISSSRRTLPCTRRSDTQNC